MLGPDTATSTKTEPKTSPMWTGLGWARLAQPMSTYGPVALRWFYHNAVKWIQLNVILGHRFFYGCFTCMNCVNFVFYLTTQHCSSTTHAHTHEHFIRSPCPNLRSPFPCGTYNRCIHYMRLTLLSHPPMDDPLPTWICTHPNLTPIWIIFKIKLNFMKKI